jgi:uncharacterized repeat protein (TIGR03803 family)
MFSRLAMEFNRLLAPLAVRGCLAMVLFAACAWASNPKTVVLYKFTGGADGRSPNGQFIADDAGNLYGTTEFGGIADSGVVFELSPPVVKGGKWKQTVLYSFTGGSDGLGPNAGLVFDGAGNLYGTTFDGGKCHQSCGVVFQLARPTGRRGAWIQTVLHAFGGVDSSDGGAPTGSLVFDKAGNLYGTTEFGGNVVCTNNPGPCGVVFQLSPPKSQGGRWTKTVLYNFKGIPDGAFPFGYLTTDKQGNLFGATTQGGTGACMDGEGATIGCGVAFKLTSRKGGIWSETLLYNFQTSDSGAGLDWLLDSTGALYGPGGYNVIKLAPPARHGGPWTEIILHRFKGGISGLLPSSPLISDLSGNLFGTAWGNAINSPYGIVYELSPPAKGRRWNLTTLHRFPGNFDTAQPKGRLMRNQAGVLFGATSSIDGSGNEVVFEVIP